MLTPPPSSTSTDIVLARLAAAGESTAKTQVAKLADPIAKHRSKKYCKRFCGSNRQHYYCTVDPSWGRPSENTPGCEWGTFSYFFFFDALASPKTLLQYEGRNGATLTGFFHAIAGSLGLWERWKNKRFERRTHIPLAVADLDPLAKRVYLMLLDRHAVPNIAQLLNQPENTIAALVRKIKRTLVEERRVYMESPEHVVSIDDLVHGDVEDPSLGFEDHSIEEQEILDRVKVILTHLSQAELFILEAMVMESLSAESVLQELRRENLPIKAGESIHEANINQIYYLRDKIVARLQRSCNL